MREEIHHVREGKHGAKSAKQAVAIGLSKARRAGVKLAPPNTVTSSGYRAFSLRASANDATVCWNVQLKPTTRTPGHGYDSTSESSSAGTSCSRVRSSRCRT